VLRTRGEDSYDHLRHACKLGPSKAILKGEGLATSPGMPRRKTLKGHEWRVQVLLSHHGRLRHWSRSSKLRTMRWRHVSSLQVGGMQRKASRNAHAESVFPKQPIGKSINSPGLGHDSGKRWMAAFPRDKNAKAFAREIMFGQQARIQDGDSKKGGRRFSSFALRKRICP